MTREPGTLKGRIHVSSDFDIPFVWFQPMPLTAVGSDKPWYQTRLCKRWIITESLARLWVKHFTPGAIGEAANDRDHCRW